MNKKKIILIVISSLLIIIIFFLNFKDNYVDNFNLQNSIDINILLSEPAEAYKKYHNKYIKVTGKISKISGTSTITLQAYIKEDKEINGHVTFNETSKLTIDLNGVDISNYQVYDYITIIGMLNDYNIKNQELVLIKPKLVQMNLYNHYEMEVIESSKCNNILKDYIDNLYTYCIDNIYLNYEVDKYELSYALQIQKISLNNFLETAEIKLDSNYKIYKLDKINILSCSNNKNIIFSKNSKINYSFCKE